MTLLVQVLLLLLQTDRYAEYPKLKELVERKDGLIAARATPPFFLKVGLLHCLRQHGTTQHLHCCGCTSLTVCEAAASATGSLPLPAGRMLEHRLQRLVSTVHKAWLSDQHCMTCCHMMCLVCHALYVQQACARNTQFKCIVPILSQSFQQM